MTLFTSKRLSVKIGLLLALLHMGYFLFSVAEIVATQDALWQLGWLHFFWFDVPASVLLIPLAALCPQQSLAWLPYPLGELRDFWLPAILFGVGGTFWYFFLPIWVAKIAGHVRPRGSSENRRPSQ